MADATRIDWVDCTFNAWGAERSTALTASTTTPTGATGAAHD